MFVPFLQLLVAVWFHSACSLSLWHNRKTKESTTFAKICWRQSGFWAVLVFSLFESSCFFLVLALYLNDLLYPGNVHGNLVSSSCYRISLFYSQSTINKIINFTSTDWKIKAAWHSLALTALSLEVRLLCDRTEPREDEVLSLVKSSETCLLKCDAASMVYCSTFES